MKNNQYKEFKNWLTEIWISYKPYKVYLEEFGDYCTEYSIPIAVRDSLNNLYIKSIGGNMKVIKRNGSEVEFNKNKIINAIIAANNSVELEDRLDMEHIEEIAKAIETNSTDKITVEEIQDIVEHYLLKFDKYKLGKHYITYRYEHELKRRNQNADIMKVVEEKLLAKDVQNSNANLDERSFGGRTGGSADAVAIEYALSKLVTETTKLNHLENRVYIHDLNSYSVGCHNCLTCDIEDLLSKGFTLRQVDIRPAKTLSTAFQLVAVIFQVQSLQQFGGVSCVLDWPMVPYFRLSFYKYFNELLAYEGLPELDMKTEDIKNISIEDKDFYKVDNHTHLSNRIYNQALKSTLHELKQSVEGLYHNLNSLQSRSGNQLPFSSINYGTNTTKEGQYINEAIIDGCIKGVGKYHRTSIFPCGIFQVMAGVNKYPGDPNYYLFRKALESTAKRIYPNYVNCDCTLNAGYDRDDYKTYLSTMGCRTMNLADINAEPGVNIQRKTGRGNICPTTIILPTIAMESKKYADITGKDILTAFFANLNKTIDEAITSLRDRFKYIASQSADSARFMYDNKTMSGYKPEEGIVSALKHGTLACGLIGIAETLQILIGCDQTDPRGMELAKRILQLFKDKCGAAKKLYSLNVGVYYTPAESLCHTAMKKFKAKYGEIPNISDHDFFTNSIHVPVWHKLTPFEKIDIESQLTGYSSAGCITYVELDSTAVNNINALETLVLYAMNHDIPYFAINVPIDTCLDCGHQGELPTVCPECGSRNIQRLRRVTGYLSQSLEHMNYGKQKEVEHRTKHTSVKVEV